MEGHEVEGEVLKLVRPGIVLLQVFLQPLHAELGQHDLGETHVVDFEAAPQCVHALNAQVQGELADEGGLPAACGTCGGEMEKQLRLLWQPPTTALKDCIVWPWPVQRMSFFFFFFFFFLFVFVFLLRHCFIFSKLPKRMTALNFYAVPSEPSTSMKWLR